MNLYLVQHGKSFTKKEDPEKSLTEKGIEITKAMAELFKEKKIPLSKIIYSKKKRAAQTAMIFNETMQNKIQMESSEKIYPKSSIKEFSDNAKLEENTMIIGHLPFMEEFISYLVVGEKDRRIIKFQNSCIICLEITENKKESYIKWALMPEIN